jgi:gluconolactonase
MQAQTGGSVVRLDPALDKIVPVGAKVEPVFSEGGFFEGPTWIPGHPGHLIFVNIAGNVIYALGPNSKVSVALYNLYSGDTTDAVVYDSGRRKYKLIGADGTALDNEGRLTYCEFGGRRVVRVEWDGTRTVLADRYEGKRLNMPNDLVYKSDDSLYFTDSAADTKRSEGDPRKGTSFAGVYRLANGSLRLLTRDLMPNGIAFSPDERYLYLTHGPQKVMRYDVLPDGAIANGQVFADMARDPAFGFADGLKVDRDGNVYAVGPGGVWIITTAGQHIGTILAPQKRFTNLGFGGEDGKTLYLTAPEGLYRISMQTSRILSVK